MEEGGKYNLRGKTSTEADLCMSHTLELAVRDFKIENTNMLKDVEEKISRMIAHMGKSQQINGNYEINSVKSRAKNKV